MSLFDIISVVFPDPKIFLCIPASAADAAAVDPKGINMLFANDVITFFIKGKQFLAMDQLIYLKILLIIGFLVTKSSKFNIGG